MSDELNLNLFVNTVLNSMSDTLSDEQLQKLKDTLFINLHDVKIQKQTYDLALTTDNDAEKIRMFVITEKVLKIADSSIKQYVWSAMNLRTIIGKNFVDITAMDIKFLIAQKRNSQEWSDSTVISQCDNLRVFFDFLYSEEYITQNPMLKIKNIRCDTKVKYPFSAMEMEAMRNVCYKDTRRMAIIEFLYATGLRVSSLVCLKWRNLDIFNKKGVVWMKGGDTEEFLFNEKSAFYLLKLLDERMTYENRTKEEMMDRPVIASIKRDPKTNDYECLTTNRIRQLLNKIGEEAGIEEIFPHKFRRTFACDALNHGMSLEDLMKHMHHKQYDTTLKYAKLNNNRIEHSYRTYCE